MLQQPETVFRSPLHKRGEFHFTSEVLMAKEIILEPSRTLGEFRLLPGLTLPESTAEQISLQTRMVNRPGSGKAFMINIPLVSAAMQSVSGVKMGIELARQGGVAFIFASQTSEQQAQMVAKVKSHKAGFVEPSTIPPDMNLSELSNRRSTLGFSTFPVVDENNILIGLITKNDFEVSVHGSLQARERMIPR